MDYVRCSSQDTGSQNRCMGDEGHAGAHWADVGGGYYVLRWGMRGRGCPDPACNRKPGHDGPHRDGHGMTWVYCDGEEDDTDPVPIAWVSEASGVSG